MAREHWPFLAVLAAGSVVSQTGQGAGGTVSGAGQAVGGLLGGGGH